MFEEIKKVTERPFFWSKVEVTELENGDVCISARDLGNMELKALVECCVCNGWLCMIDAREWTIGFHVFKSLVNPVAHV